MSIDLRKLPLGDRGERSLRGPLRESLEHPTPGIYINEDLCPASQEIKNSQIPLMKKAREVGKIAFFKQTKLIIKERGDQAYEGFTRLRTAGAGTDGASADGGGEAVRAGDRQGKDVPSSASADVSSARTSALRGPAVPSTTAVGGHGTSSPGGAGVRGSADSPNRRQQRPQRSRNK